MDLYGIFSANYRSTHRTTLNSIDTEPHCEPAPLQPGYGRLMNFRGKMMTTKVTVAAVLAAVIVTSATVATRQQAWATDAPAEPKPTTTTAPAPAAPNQTATGQETPAAVPEVVMAQVAGKKITVEQFMRYVTQDTRLVLKARTAPGKTEILREMILDRLMEEAMLREGLLPTDQAPNDRDYLKAYQQLAKQRFPAPSTPPSEEEMYKYYQQHAELFGIPAMVRISQIQLRTPNNADEATKTAVKAKAEDVLKRLRAGESFAKLAEALTENPQGKVAQGDLGFLQPEKDSWLKKAVDGLAVGQFSEVLESPVGYEIILLQDRRDAMIAPYANVRDNVLQRIQQEAQVKAREAYAWKLAKEVGVSVEMPELKGAIPETTP
jgi:parvulin-like peptidyl-prolyl isomerase